MLLYCLAIIAGFSLLVWGADRFVLGASATARNLGVPPLIIGLTIVGFGTSAPEMLVSGVAAWQGNPGLSIGNALGSNITNIALVLGVTAIITPLNVHSDTLRREFPILLAIMLFALLIMLDGDLSRMDGILLLSGLGAMIYWLVRLGRQKLSSDPMESEYDKEIPGAMSTRTGIGWIAAGLVTLLLSSQILVWGAVNIAQILGVSDLVIGLTVVAIGTSLPELAASVISAIKKEHEIAIGNVIGSNMYNLLGVMGLPGVIGAGVFDRAVLVRDFPVMIGLTLALFVTAYGFNGTGRINRIEGAMLFMAFIAYQVFLYYTA